MKKKVAVVVAHPDDETLWAGWTILSLNPPGRASGCVEEKQTPFFEKIRDF